MHATALHNAKMRGGPLDLAYTLLPAPLICKIELFYSRDNRTPDYRFIEPLLDVLFAGGLTEHRLTKLRAELGLSGERAALFRSYFRLDEEQLPEPVDDMVDYLGHACVFARYQGTTFLVDRVLSYAGYPSEFDGRLTFADLPRRIDYVMIRHNHQDHMPLETLIKIRHRVGTVLLHRGTQTRLGAELAGRFAAIGLFDVPRSSDLDNDDRASDQMIELVRGFTGQSSWRSATGGAARVCPRTCARSTVSICSRSRCWPILATRHGCLRCSHVRQGRPGGCTPRCHNADTAWWSGCWVLKRCPNPWYTKCYHDPARRWATSRRSGLLRGSSCWPAPARPRWPTI